MLTRRSLLALSGSTLATSTLATSTLAGCSAPAPVAFQPANLSDEGTFRHGVASGDPGTNSVVLWTRVTPPEGEAGAVEVTCSIGTAPDLSDAKRVQLVAEPARDWCVKLTVGDLQPGTDYAYRFETATDRSRVGRTKTLPNGPTDQARLAVVSCANWQQGYFHTYDLIARHHAQDPFDAMIHLGDYFYEYGVQGYADRRGGNFGRRHEPDHECVSLADYRTRHAQYRTDADLQAVTALMPIIPVWDDHESANDSWESGAENHQPAEDGDWDARKRAAMRAYYDWMPVREPGDPNALWRSFSFGDLLTLACVETRLTARSEPIALEDHAETIIAGDPDGAFERLLNDPAREMFGAEQRRFITDTFAQSKRDGQPWRLMANQVIMARLVTPDMTPYVTPEAIETIAQDWEGVREFVAMSQYGVPFYPDSWDGYPAARERFYSELEAAGVRDVVVLTGDAHEFWASDLTKQDGTRMGAEIVTTSISSQTLKAYLGDNTPDFSLLMTRENEDARFYDALTNGYTELTVTPKRIRVNMWGVPDVRSPTYEAFRSAAFTLRPSRDSVKIAGPKGLNFRQRVLFAGLG